MQSVLELKGCEFYVELFRYYDCINSTICFFGRDVTGPSEGLKIWVCQYYLGGHNLSPLVEIGLTDLPKSGCAMAHPAHPGTTGLL